MKTFAIYTAKQFHSLASQTPTANRCHIPVLWFSMTTSGKGKGHFCISTARCGLHGLSNLGLPLPPRRTRDRRVSGVSTVFCSMLQNRRDGVGKWKPPLGIGQHSPQKAFPSLFFPALEEPYRAGEWGLYTQSFGIQMPFQLGKCQELTLLPVTLWSADKGY